MDVALRREAVSVAPVRFSTTCEQPDFLPNKSQNDLVEFAPFDPGAPDSELEEIFDRHRETPDPVHLGDKAVNPMAHAAELEHVIRELKKLHRILHGRTKENIRLREEVLKIRSQVRAKP